MKLSMCRSNVEVMRKSCRETGMLCILRQSETEDICAKAYIMVPIYRRSTRVNVQVTPMMQVCLSRYCRYSIAAVTDSALGTLRRAPRTGMRSGISRPWKMLSSGKLPKSGSGCA